MQILILPSLIVLLAAGPVSGHHSERWYQEHWCAEQGGRTEVVLDDRTRCDCLTGTHAVEFDFARKSAEAISQALYYALKTGKRAGIVLILEKPGDARYLDRILAVIYEFNLPIDVWMIGARQACEWETHGTK